MYVQRCATAVKPKCLLCDLTSCCSMLLLIASYYQFLSSWNMDLSGPQTSQITSILPQSLCIAFIYSYGNMLTPLILVIPTYLRPFINMLFKILIFILILFVLGHTWIWIILGFLLRNQLFSFRNPIWSVRNWTQIPDHVYGISHNY